MKIKSIALASILTLSVISTIPALAYDISIANNYNYPVIYVKDTTTLGTVDIKNNTIAIGSQATAFTANLHDDELNTDVIYGLNSSSGDICDIHIHAQYYADTSPKASATVTGYGNISCSINSTNLINNPNPIVTISFKQ